MGNKQNSVSPEVLFGNIIRQHRIQQGLTQADLEGEDGLERSYISRLEAGQYQVCLRGILHLAQALGISAAQLINELESALQQQT